MRMIAQMLEAANKFYEEKGDTGNTNPWQKNKKGSLREIITKASHHDEDDNNSNNNKDKPLARLIVVDDDPDLAQIFREVFS
jgi:hypothetical protein